MEHRYSLDRLLECYPLSNVRRLTIEHRIRCSSIKNDVPSALLSYPLTSLTLNIQLHRYEDLYELLMCYPTLKHLDTSFADVLDMNRMTGMDSERIKVNQGAILSIQDLSTSSSILHLCSSIQLFVVVEWYPRKPDADLLEITRRFICNALPRLHLTNRLEVHCKVLQHSFDEMMYLTG
ncbi:uncharacterized protein BT62DRAFT_935271 [Guyanagaster necrorhizus]|uniref:Uncharacterized protein n=1 Tax=Guyanagaster necrorhizus TaxID=856835 RepID=A0A9P8AQ07_9AGAR|nr:uncharacterized protein BT62DRAFT_935271 [Guyanagaster necrorhizus MCA 3950]KAG7443331.1 hypothetical protein BT62DRAFT_935271 [Guyanagaster necrorhizus MCA 3950]